MLYYISKSPTILAANVREFRIPPSVDERERKKGYRFHCTCVQSTSELINSMRDRAKTVKYRTMLRHCRGLGEIAHQLGYRYSSNQGLALKHDWHVSYHRSIYDGHPCYYFVHSGIEHIWIKEEPP